MKTLRILLIALLAWALLSVGAAVRSYAADADAAQRHAEAQKAVKRLRGELLAAARIVLRSGLHSFNWSDEEALDYLTQTIGLSGPAALAELEAAK